jgi:putative transcriptional regulator
MLSKGRYKEEVLQVLDSTAREHATTFDDAYCFDSVVNEGQTHIAIKVSLTIDDVKSQPNQELRRICQILHCTPLIVGERTRKRPLEDGVVHTRANVTAINLETLRQMLERRHLPSVRVKKGGVYVTISADRLKLARQGQNLSRGDVAAEIGVSRRAVYEYERGTMNPTIDVAMHLEELLGIQLIEPISLLQGQGTQGEASGIEPRKLSRLARKTIGMLLRLGFDSTITQDAPFDMLASLRRRVFLTCLKQPLQRLDENRLVFLARLADVLDEEPAIITSEKPGIERIDGIPVVYLEELVSIEDPSDFLLLIRHRRGA